MMKVYIPTFCGALIQGGVEGCLMGRGDPVTILRHAEARWGPTWPSSRLFPSSAASAILAAGHPTPIPTPAKAVPFLALRFQESLEKVRVTRGLLHLEPPCVSLSSHFQFFLCKLGFAH